MTLAACATSPEMHYDDIERRVQGRTLHAVPEGTARPSAEAEARLGPRMSVGDVVAVALLENEALNADLARVGVATGMLVDAGSVSNPEAEVESYFDITGDGPFTLEFAVLQKLNDFLIRNHRRDAARMELQRTKVELTRRILSHAAMARSAAYDYLAARRLLQLRREVRSGAASSYEATERMYRAGNTSRLELKRRHVAREEARLAERLAERRLSRAREKLNRLMSLYGERAGQWDLAATLPALPGTDRLPLEDLETIAVGASLDLEASRFGLEAAAARGRTAAASAWPHVAVGAAVETEPAEGAVALGPALEFELPIFRFGKGAIDAAEAELQARKYEYEQQAIELRSRTRDARDAMSEAGDRARFLQNVVLPLRRDVTDETLKMYNGMYVGVFELLQARREEIESTVQWVEAVRDYWKARVQVELAIEGVMPRSEAASAAPMTSGGKTAGPDEH